MSARACFALLAIASSLSVAAAQPQIPRSEMGGRERERFIDNPNERFMKPGPYVTPSVVDGAKPEPKPKVKRAKRQKH